MTSDVNNNLNIIPAFVKGTLSKYFNNNKNSIYVQRRKVGESEAIQQRTLLKVLPPGAEFIIGGIFEGTRQVYQTCDNHNYVELSDCQIPC